MSLTPLCREGLLGGNYFGNHADGEVTLNANTELPSTKDGDAIVKHYTSLTINSGTTLTTSNRCRGLIVFIDGDCTINGTLSMAARGCHADPAIATVTSNTPVAPSDGNPVPEEGIVLRFEKDGATAHHSASDIGHGLGSAARDAFKKFPKVKAGLVTKIPRTGGTGAPGATESRVGYTGSSITNGTGGGGSGGAYGAGSKQGGNGGSGTCFSGGSGAGGFQPNSSIASGQGAGNNFGGPAEDVASYSSGCGGAGNPGGRGMQQLGGGNNSGENGNTGTGGLLILCVSGDLTIGSSGRIEANGTTGSPPTGLAYSSGGGGSGGGVAAIFYGGTFTNNGTISAHGGSGGVVGYYDGGRGGNGSIIGPHKINNK